MAAGGAWRVPEKDIDYSSDTNARIPLIGGRGFIIDFRPVPGWLLPTNQIVDGAADQETILDAYYIDARPSLLGYRLEEGLRLYAGETGAVDADWVFGLGENSSLMTALADSIYVASVPFSDIDDRPRLFKLNANGTNVVDRVWRVPTLRRPPYLNNAGKDIYPNKLVEMYALVAGVDKVSE